MQARASAATWPPGGRDPRWVWGALSPAGMRSLLRERGDALALLGRARRRTVVGLCVVLLVAAVVPGLSALVSGMVVGAVVDAGPASSFLSDVLPAIVAFAALVVIEQVALVFRDLGRDSVVGQIDGSIRSSIRRMAYGSARITPIEQSAFRDDAAQATEPSALFGRTAGLAATGQLLLFERMLTLVVPMVMLIAFSVRFAVVVFVGAVVLRTLGRRQFMALTRYAETQLGMQRRSDYVETLALDAGSAKELRLFGWTDWLIGQWRASAKTRIDDFSLAHRSVLRRQLLNGLLAAGLGAFVALDPGLRLLHAHGNAAAHIVRVVSAALVVMQYSHMGWEGFDMDYGLAGARAFGRLAQRHAIPAQVASSPRKPQFLTPPDLRFDNISFSYPNGDPVLDRLDLRVTPGEVLAIVGDNGAGKTTLMKLLAALYEPTGGTITANGEPIHAYSQNEWRRTLSVVYQDFVRYPGTVRENVALGAPEALPSDSDILVALASAGMETFVQGLPHGLDTPLWQASAGGVDMSGGQWQRLALARALFAVRHGRRILVMDEPTAQLDVTAEAAFYDQVIATVEGASVIMISHRLSTVRHADRIVLLRDGRIAESGSHDELMASGSSYAKLFDLQAARFRAGR